MQLSKHYAEHVARARRELAEATARHAAAVEKVGRIEARIADCQCRQREITQQRLEGEAGPETAAEFAALGGDIETLSGMLSAARQEAVAAEPHAQHTNLVEAERQLARHQAEVELEAVKGRAAEIEVLFLRSVAALNAAGKRAGRVRLGETWQPSNQLTRLVHYGVAPEA